MRTGLRMGRRTRRAANLLEQIVAAFVIVFLRPDVVWCNTVLSACYVRPGRLLGKRVVLHAHEAGGQMAQVLARYRLDRYWSSVHLVGCAPRVCSELAAATGRRVEDVVCIRSVPDYRRICDLAQRAATVLPAHGVLVGACGLATHSKGVDLWLAMVEQVVPAVADLDPHFVWIGADAPPEFFGWASATALDRRVTFTGSLENPYPVLAALDVFTLTSRSDSFPLVVLESMQLGRPVVAFDVGDVASQLGSTGRVVEPLATSQFADEVVALLRDPAERLRLGAASEDRACEEFNIARFGKDVRGLACRLVGGPQSGAGD
ncbi:MAG TPA: glycosyltransferase family 4 protein [Acidimicrobiales bacterium]|nr:glycosyltransferase family 4 protein [Acidimicrobiales bacterium]